MLVLFRTPVFANSITKEAFATSSTRQLLCNTLVNSVARAIN